MQVSTLYIFTLNVTIPHRVLHARCKHRLERKDGHDRCDVKSR